MFLKGTKKISLKKFVHNTKAGFTLIELLVVVAIISLLVSILLPSLSAARDLAKSVVCMSNLKNIGQGVAFYSNDYNDVIWQSYTGPGYGEAWPYWWHLGLGWYEYLPKPAGSWGGSGAESDVWNCPVAGKMFNDWGIIPTITYLRVRNAASLSAGWGSAGWLNMARVPNPSSLMFLIDGQPVNYSTVYGNSGAQTGGTTWYDVIETGNSTGFGGGGFLHLDKANVMFCDWHIETLPANSITEEMCTLE